MNAIVSFSDTVFAVNESTTDYHVTFVKHFSINIRKATSSTFRLTQGSVTLEIKIYPNGTKTMYKGYVCVSIDLISSPQKIIDLITTFTLKASDGGWNKLEVSFSKLTAQETQTYNLTSLDHVMNAANTMLDDGGMFTIGMTGSYLIHSQRTIVTSQTKFNAKTHTSVNMSYTWTVCNLTLPLVDVSHIKSKNFFTELGVAEFNIQMYPGTEYEDFVSVYNFLVNLPSIKRSPQVEYSFELIDSNSPERAVIDYFSESGLYEFTNIGWGRSQHFKYTDFVKSMRQQCVTMKFHVEYEQP